MENTPYYYYDLELLDRTLTEVEMNIKSRPFKVHYAVKANNNKQILEAIAARGFGADCVSATEITWALNAGFRREDIVFAGVGKTDDEIEYALANRTEFAARRFRLGACNQFAGPSGNSVPFSWSTMKMRMLGWVMVLLRLIRRAR